jgi:crossover junction endodeoxyribonuclease RuvC
VIRVAGLDLSLTSTGLAIVEATDGAFTWTVERIRSTGKAGDTLQQRADRLARLERSIGGRVLAARPDLAVVEGPSFGQASQGGQHDRAGLWWGVVKPLHQAGIPVVEVSPNGRAKYGTGKGNASKDAVLAAAIRRYLQIDITGNDEADAVLLAAMGMRHLGHPVEPSLPSAHLDAMTNVRWPERSVLAV